MTGTLFVLPVPLADADPRDVLPPPVLTIAREARYLLAENARSARAFLKAAGHPGPIQQVRIIEIGHQPQVSQALEWLAPLRSGQTDAALVSECGCPGIADPGATVVACAHDLGLRVRPLVGPSSLCLALMASGMNGQRFRFHGYLPQDASALADSLRRIERDALGGETQMFIETPYRTERLFQAILAHCADSTRLGLALELPQAERPALQRRPAVFLLHSEGSPAEASSKRLSRVPDGQAAAGPPASRRQ